VSAFFLSFGVIFVAELGDKSQLMAMTFAARYRAMPVLIGITIATAITHAISVAIGAVLGASIPTETIALLAGVAFLKAIRIGAAVAFAVFGILLIAETISG